MKFNTSGFEPLHSSIQYYGYKGINLDDLNITDFNGIAEYQETLTTSRFLSISKADSKLLKLPLETAKRIAKSFFELHFDIHNINVMDDEDMLHIAPYLMLHTTPEGFYNLVNSKIKSIDQFDIHIERVNGPALEGYIEKKLIMMTTPEGVKYPGRKVIYGDLKLGSNTNLLTSCALVHEITHSQQESNIGFADDYLHTEFLPIFLEKVFLDEFYKKTEALRIAENSRFSSAFYNFFDFIIKDLSIPDQIEAMTYLKSTLFAIKLFDMYQKDKEKDSYFKEVQDVFDGKAKVEDIIYSRKIKLNECFEPTLILKHM